MLSRKARRLWTLLMFIDNGQIFLDTRKSVLRKNKHRAFLYKFLGISLNFITKNLILLIIKYLGIDLKLKFCRSIVHMKLIA